jgi:membrane dipeptidase
MVNRGRFNLFAAVSEQAPQYSKTAIELVEASMVIDMLGLITLDFPKLYGWHRNPASFTHAEFEKVRASGIDVFHPAVGFNSGDIHAQSLADLQGWNRLVSAHPDYFLRVNGPADLAHVYGSGKIGILFGQQNSAHFRNVDDVDLFYGMGQRVSQLTYYRNRLGGASTDSKDSGLTQFGGEVLGRMNKLGMAVDVSHCGDRTTLDAIAASAKPVLVTHSNCRILVPGSARCKTDEAIKKLSLKGGVIGLTMIRFFVGTSHTVTMDQVLDHVDHVAKIAGIEHVGLGTDRDLDGFDVRADLDGVQYSKKIFDFTEGLLRRKYSPQDISLILGKNFARVLDEIFTVS